MILSIIIPVYNNEKYIKRCLDSILLQPFRDLECIVVDDGSDDNSLKICKEIQRKDCRLKIFHTENKGVSNARNLGLINAVGDYIGFIDGDDYIDDNAFTTIFIMQNLKDYDVICFGIRRVFDNGLIDKVQFKQKKLVDEFIHYSSYMHSVCNKIFSRTLFDQYNISFDVGISVCEDMLVAFKALSYAKKVKYIDGYFYNYYKNTNSVSNIGTNRKRLNDYKSVAQCLETFCKENGSTFEYHKFIKYRKLCYTIFYLTDINFFSPQNFRSHNEEFNIWTYTYRPDLFFITFFSSLHIDLPAYLYISMKKIKDKISNRFN